MQLIDTELTLAEREQVEAAMGSDKTLLWAGRPVAKAWTLTSVLSVFSGVVACCILGYMTSIVWSSSCGGDFTPNLIFSCFLLPFWIVVLWQLLTPWRQLRRLRRTAYLLTPQQAIVLEPGWFGKMKLHSYPICPDMVRDREVETDGSGSLVFAYRTVQGKHGPRRIPQGFLGVPRVQEVEDILAAVQQGNEVPAAAPQPEPEAPSVSGGNKFFGVIFGGMFALVGIGALVMSGISAADSREIVENGVIAEGEVSSLKRERGRKGKVMYYPVFRFTAQDGKEYRVKHNQGSNVSAWKRGEKVELIYLPEAPEKAFPNTTWGKYGASLVLGIVGIIFSVVGIFVVWQCSTASGKRQSS